MFGQSNQIIRGAHPPNGYRRSYTTEDGVEMRRISWAEFERITGRKRPAHANDNEQQEQARGIAKSRTGSAGA